MGRSVIVRSVKIHFNEEPSLQLHPQALTSSHELIAFISLENWIASACDTSPFLYQHVGIYEIIVYGL